jgi:hypothetical protein
MTDGFRSLFLPLVAGAFGTLAVVLWFLFVRPVPSAWAEGAIAGKTFKPADTYWQYPPGTRQGFRTANPIPVAESYVFEIHVPEFPGPAHYALNTVASEKFEVGQHVRVQYVRRGIAGIWSRVWVLDMKSE